MTPYRAFIGSSEWTVGSDIVPNGDRVALSANRRGARSKEASILKQAPTSHR